MWLLCACPSSTCMQWAYLWTVWQGTELCLAVLAEPLSFFLSFELLCPWKGDQRGQEETSLQAPVCWILGAHRSCSGSTGLGALEGQRGILWIHGYTLHNRKPGKKWQFSQICQSAFKKNTEKIPTFSRGLLICSGSSSNNTSLSDRDPDFCSRTQTGKVRGGPSCLHLYHINTGAFWWYGQCKGPRPTWLEVCRYSCFCASSSLKLRARSSVPSLFDDSSSLSLFVIPELSEFSGLQLASLKVRRFFLGL